MTGEWSAVCVLERGIGMVSREYCVVGFVRPSLSEQREGIEAMKKDLVYYMYTNREKLATGI